MQQIGPSKTRQDVLVHIRGTWIIDRFVYRCRNQRYKSLCLSDIKGTRLHTSTRTSTGKIGVPELSQQQPGNRVCVAEHPPAKFSTRGKWRRSQLEWWALVVQCRTVRDVP